MLHADYRGSISKGGPRALTFTSTTAGTYTNCPKCENTTGVLGEEGGDPAPLVHGWYQIESDMDCYWQQITPDQACTANPLLNGKKIPGGNCASFFVDHAQVDGIIAVYVCSGADVPDACHDVTIEGVVRVSRTDTVLSMATTGENANLRSPDPSKACG